MALLSKRVIPSASETTVYFCAMCTFLIWLFLAQETALGAPLFGPEVVLTLSKTHCVVAVVKANQTDTERTADGDAFTDLLAIADVAFRSEPKVIFGACDLENFIWPSGKQLDHDGERHESRAVVFPQLLEDRTCLHKPDYHQVYPKSVGYSGPILADSFVGFVNHHCNTFRKSDGSLTHQGLHREYLLENLFSVKELPSSVTVSSLIKKHGQIKKSDHCLKEAESGEIHCPDLSENKSYLHSSNIPNCERIPLPEKSDFINNYLTRSKPVIITGAMNSWPAMTKWTNEFLLKQYGEREVHIKLTPKGEYEGIEQADIWEPYKTFKIPSDVLKQLPYPDLVVVRPAGISMNFSEFLDLVQKISEGTFVNVSAYLEYTSVADYFPELKSDLNEMEFFENVLKMEHLNIWLSDGNTLGKTHFDPYDNFLCQISGEKEVTLFEPHGDFLYEAHIPEAILSYNSTLKQFRRSTLLDSTSMVMTPVDILHPHLERFPKFGSARPMSCTIKEGDVLFMPAFWWHEVQSRPSTSERRNLAVNFWYEPFFKKEFPCPECELDVNPKYNHLL